MVYAYRYVHLNVCCCDAGQGLTLHASTYGVSNEGKQVIRKKKCHVHLVLIGLYADAIARIKLQRTLGLGAFLPCGCCLMSAKRVQSAKSSNRSVLRVMGYSQPVVAERQLLKGQAVQMVVDDERLQLSSDDQLGRAELCEQMREQYDAQFAAWEEACEEAREAGMQEPVPPKPPPLASYVGVHGMCVVNKMHGDLCARWQEQWSQGL